MEHWASSEPNVYSPVQGILRTDLYRRLSLSLVAYLMGESVCLNVTVRWHWGNPVESQFKQSGKVEFRSTQ
jgi:hypothetical protein